MVAAALLPLLFLAVACGADDAPSGYVPVVAVASVTVTPARDSLLVGGTRSLTASPRDAAGRPLDGRVVVWTSSTPAVATISAAGEVTARAPGVATLVATSEGRAGQAELTVLPILPAQPTLDVTPTGVVIAQGATRQLRAIVRDAAGAEVPNAAVTWETDNAPVARVDATGLVTAVAHGYATIIARYGTLTFGIAVTVEAPPPPSVVAIDVAVPTTTLGAGDATQLQATPRGPGGAALDRPVTWASGDTTIAAVDATGRVTGRRPGDVRIVVASDEVTRTIAFTVLAVREFKLTHVRGAALPQTVYTTTERGADGAPRAVRWDAHEGVIRMRADGVYEQRIGYWIVRDGSPATQGTYGFRGTYRSGIVADQLLFSPSGDGLSPFTARLFPDIVLTATQQIAGGAPAAEFVYTMW